MATNNEASASKPLYSKRQGGSAEAHTYGIDDCWSIFKRDEEEGDETGGLIAVVDTETLADKIIAALEPAVVASAQDDEPCYFKCDACGHLTTAPIEDVKSVGRPVCTECSNRGGADEDGMDEIEKEEYDTLKAEQDAVPKNRFGPPGAWRNLRGTTSLIDTLGDEHLINCVLWVDMVLKKEPPDAAELATKREELMVVVTRRGLTVPVGQQPPNAERCELCDQPLENGNGDNWDGLCPGCADRVSVDMDASNHSREKSIEKLREIDVKEKERGEAQP